MKPTTRPTFNIFHRCGLEVIAVKSDTGMMGGKLAHEFMFLNTFGEDTLMLCEQCGFSANRQVATFQKTAPAAEEALPLNARTYASHQNH